MSSIAGRSFGFAGSRTTCFLVLFLYLLLLSTPGRGETADYSLAICAIVRDEHAHMLDWIDYHEALGFDKFYIFDDNSTPPMGHILKPHIDSGLVHYTFKDNILRESPFPLMYVFDTCINSYGARHRWMAFIDPDEFIHLKQPAAGAATMAEFMRRYEAYAGLALNWRLFGSSGILAKPTGHPLQTFTKCTPQDEPQNTHVKMIVYPPTVVRSLTPHNFQFAEGTFAVNEAFEPTPGPIAARVVADKVALLHFVVRSREDFEEKMVRTRPSNGMNMGHKELPYFHSIDALATEDCAEGLDALAHARALRNRTRARTQ